jgi:CARDB
MAMRFHRFLLATALAALSATAAPAAASADPPQSVHLKACRTGTGMDPSPRSATFVGKMHDVPGSVRMGMHFRLIERSAQNGTQPMRSPDLGPWHTSNDGVKHFSYSQTVNGLTQGDSYRVVVKFRWIDSSGKVIRRAKRTSAACVQPGPPNLTVDSIAIKRDTSLGTSVFHVKISNDGEVLVKSALLELFTDGAEADSRRLKNLQPGETRTVKLTGPICATVRATVDPKNRVAESNEHDNSLTRSC